MLDVVLYRVGVWGIPLATSLVNIVGAALLVFFLRRRVGGARPGARHRRDRAHHDRLGRARRGRLRRSGTGSTRRSAARLGAQIVSLGVALGVGAAVYLGACRALRVRELSALRSSIAG